MIARRYLANLKDLSRYLSLKSATTTKVRRSSTISSTPNPPSLSSPPPRSACPPGWMRRPVKKRNVFAKYGSQTRAVLDALLDKFADGGVKSVESLDILKVDPLSAFGTPVEIVKLFGGKEKYLFATVKGILNSVLNPDCFLDRGLL
ncbi:MAG: type I restriction-modification enzyme R subunit C-terminal domain-containing protein [Sulfuricella sp.]